MLTYYDYLIIMSFDTRMPVDSTWLIIINKWSVREPSILYVSCLTSNAGASRLILLLADNFPAPAALPSPPASPALAPLPPPVLNHDIVQPALSGFPYHSPLPLALYPSPRLASQASSSCYHLRSSRLLCSWRRGAIPWQAANHRLQIQANTGSTASLLLY